MKLAALLAFAAVTYVTIYRWLRDDLVTEDSGLTHWRGADAVTDARETIEVTGSHFIHDTPVSSRPSARCTTPRPESTCDCGMFFLRWIHELEML